MEDVGDGEVVAEGGDDEGDCGEEYGYEDHDSGAAGSFSHAIPYPITLEDEREQSGNEAIDRQTQGEE
jgi:hypothetical protein